jgi:hypothetical protein
MPFPITNWKVFAAAALVAIAFAAGWRVAAWRHDAGMASALQEQKEAFDKKDAQRLADAEKLEAQLQYHRKKAKERNVEIRKIVEAGADYRDCYADPDGMLLLQDRILDVNTTRQRAYSLPDSPVASK